MPGAIDSKDKPGFNWQPILRVAIAVVGLFCCYRLILDSATTGLSRLYTTLSIIEFQVEPADRAVTLTPTDPEAHYTRALALVNSERLQEAAAELRQSIQLRPHHYYEWLDLGVTLDRLGDPEGALVAFKESIRLAPSFAQPRWQLGNFLFRQGKYQDAFAELRLGVKSNPSLSYGLLDLAWAATDGDVSTMRVLVAPDTSSAHFALANYLAHHGKAEDAAREARQAGVPRGEADELSLQQIIATLLHDKHFYEARDAWTITHNAAVGEGNEILNGDFADPIAQNDPGFGWQFTPVASVSVSIDRSGPVLGTRSISLDLNGEVNPASQLLYQLVLVQPKTRYSLSFMARTQELVSGGPPIIAVYDANNDKILGQVVESTGTNDWKAGQVDFITDPETRTIRLVVQRAACSESPCPIFGKLWLGRFALIKNKN
jgi:hypothetical protein